MAGDEASQKTSVLVAEPRISELGVTCDSRPQRPRKPSVGALGVVSPFCGSEGLGRAGARGPPESEALAQGLGVLRTRNHSLSRCSA